MSNTENKGYKLADGSYSSEYKIGDKFVVAERTDAFAKNSVVEFYRDDHTESPLFKLVSGWCGYNLADNEEGAYNLWRMLNPLTEEYRETKETPDQESGVEHNAAGKATIYYTDGTTYTQTNVNYCINIPEDNIFALVLMKAIDVKIVDGVYNQVESVKLDTQHIAGIVFKHGSYEEIYKLKPTFQSTFNVYNSKHREENDSQKPVRVVRVAGDYVNQNELTEAQAIEFIHDCISSGADTGEKYGFLDTPDLEYLGWSNKFGGVFYSSGNHVFTRNVTHIYKGL